MDRKTIIIIIGLVVILTSGILIGRAWNKIPQLANGEEVVAEMEGNNITVDQLYNKIKERYARDILIDMIDSIILNEKYETDEELEAEINGHIQYIKEQTGDNFLQAIKREWGLNNEQELYEFIEMSLKRNKAIEDYAKSLITNKEIEEHYKKETVGDVKASHILIKPKVTAGMTEEEKKAKENEALQQTKDLIVRLNQGEDFAELAKEYSEDLGSGANGGDLGWFNKGRMVEPFENAVYKLTKGKYTATPVKSEFGYHIILKVDEKAKPTLEEATEKILETLANEKLINDQTLHHTALEELKKEYKLIIHDTELKNQYEEYLKEIKAK
jgi:foldase protein PrsA